MNDSDYVWAVEKSRGIRRKQAFIRLLCDEHFMYSLNTLIGSFIRIVGSSEYVYVITDILQFQLGDGWATVLVGVDTITVTVAEEMIRRRK